MNPLPADVPGTVRARVRSALTRPVRPRRARFEARWPTVGATGSAEQHALLLRLMSLLLQYPDAELIAARPVLTAAVAALPPTPAAARLVSFTGWFTEQEPQALERHYVEMFDLRRKSSLYLTYYLHGDTRRRGMALHTLAQRYHAAGWETDGGELPDHLPVALEFAALGGPRVGEAPLRQHRRGLELIHGALADAGSPYHHVLAALCTLLPPLTAADRTAVADLAAQGPPGEDVGLDPYGVHPAYGAGEFAPPGTFVPPEAAPVTTRRQPVAERGVR